MPYELGSCTHDSLRVYDDPTDIPEVRGRIVAGLEVGRTRDRSEPSRRRDVGVRVIGSPGCSGIRLTEQANAAARKQVERLEKELQRKEKALAETAALLVLQRKVEALWAEKGADTRPMSDTPAIAGGIRKLSSPFPHTDLEGEFAVAHATG
ncbi:MAG: hypothetical protein KC766_39500 [Myxococcales bacterium]|nr:hypothetical protein [Myxococcales bacterium]